jgi:hypothetical protein
VITWRRVVATSGSQVCNLGRERASIRRAITASLKLAGDVCSPIARRIPAGPRSDSSVDPGLLSHAADTLTRGQPGRAGHTSPVLLLSEQRADGPDSLRFLRGADQATE